MMYLPCLLLVGLAVGREPLVPRDVRLDNGLWVRVLEDRELPVVSVALMVPAGAAWDPPDKRGVAELTGRLLTEGTETRSGFDLGVALESLGSQIQVETLSEYTTLKAEFLSRDLQEGLGLLADVVTRPAFHPDAFAQQKELAVADLQDALQEPFTVSRRTLYRALYGDHPFGWPESGTLSSLAHIEPQDVVACHDARYRPQGSVLAIVGDVEATEVVRRIDKLFRGWKGRPEGRTLPPVPEPWKGTRLVLADLPGQTQAQIRIATRTVPMRHKDRLALEMGDAVLGGGFTSRLVQEIRVDRSLSYDAWSSLPSFADDAFLVVGTYTRNTAAREALDVLTRVLGEWRSGDLEAAAFQRAVNHEVGTFPQDVEPLAGRAQLLLDMAYHRLPAQWMARRIPDLRSVTLEKSREAVRTWVPEDGRLVVVVGDLAQIRTSLDGYGNGDWQVMPVE